MYTSVPTKPKMRANPCKHFGFTLMEVMIVVVILGILITAAYPGLNKYLVGSRQTEAKANLMAIYTAQKIYYASNRSYTSDLQLLGIGLQQSNSLYSYSAVVEGATFTVTSLGNIDDDATDDIWTINQNKELVNTSNDVIE